MKRALSFFLATLMIVTPLTTFAEKPLFTADVVLSVQPQIFSAIVPTVLPVTMSSTGKITVAEDASIVNTSKGPIIVDKIQLIDIKSSWEIVNFDINFSTFGVGSKKLGMTFNSDKVLNNGTVLLNANNWPIIDGFGELNLDYNAKLPPQNIAITDEIPTKVVFTLKWHEVGYANIEETVPSTYEFAKGDKKSLTLNFSNIIAEDDTIIWTSSDESVATVAGYTSRGRSVPLEGSKQCMVTAVGVGKTIITGTLKDGTFSSIELIVSDKVITSIAVTTPPIKTLYAENESFDSTGMVVTATYNNGTSADITDYIIVDGADLASGQTKVTISHSNKTTTQAVSITPKTLTSIAITTPPIKTSYVEGQNFDSAGMVVTAYYDNGTSNEVTPTLSRNTNLPLGQISVDVSFNGKTVTQDITVIEKVMTKIEITTPPNKTIYLEGYNFEIEGMIVSAHYNDGTTLVVTPTLGRDTSLLSGQTSIDVSYGGMTIEQSITITNKELTSITIKTPPNKIDYTHWDEFDKTGMVVEASYNNGTSAIIEDYTIVDGGCLVFGRNTINLNYNGQTAVQAITVADIPVGTKHIEGNYEYSYGQQYLGPWEDLADQKGWGVRIIDNTQTDYISPLTTIQDRPILNLLSLFRGSPTATLNLIDWDTSNVTKMSRMFENSQATTIIGLDTLDTGNVTSMHDMFDASLATSLDVSKFDTKNVTNMDNMFQSSRALDIIGLGNFNTSKVDNMSDMFRAAYTQNLDLSSFNTSNVRYMDDMFYLSNVIELDLSTFDTAKVRDMSGMFYSCSSTIIGLENFNTSRVTNMRSMFDENKYVGLDVSSFDTSRVTSMDNMFRNSLATNLDVSNFNTANVTDMSDMFRNTHSTVLDVSKFNTANVVDMGSMFLDCRTLSLDLTSFNTSNVTSMRNMFLKNQATSIVGLTSFDTSKVPDMSDMFQDSHAISLDLSSFDTSLVTTMQDMFQNSKATSINVSHFNTTNVLDMSDMFADTEVLSLDLSSFVPSSATTMNSMFHRSKATEITFGNFNTSNVTDMFKMFGYSQVPTLDLSSFDTSNVTTMAEMFKNSISTVIDVSKFNTMNVTDMGNMFWETKVTNLDLSGFDTSKVTSMNNMFYMSQVTELDLKNFNTSNVVDMSDMFQSCAATIINVSSFDTSKATSFDNMFFATKAEVIDVSGFKSSAVTDMSQMFWGAIVKVIDVSGFDTSNVIDMYGMFEGTSAKNLNLSSFNTSQVTNMASMFRLSKFESLDLSSFDTSQVTTMFEMFDYIPALTINGLNTFNTSNVTDMSSMFNNSNTLSLDLSSFNTSNVTTMARMFRGSRVTSLDVSSFNTSNVTDMSQMFQFSSAVTITGLDKFNTINVTHMYNMFRDGFTSIIDLSSFDITNVIDMNDMFYFSRATSLIARTQTEADRYKTSTSFPETLIITVKP